MSIDKLTTAILVVVGGIMVVYGATTIHPGLGWAAGGIWLYLAGIKATQ